MFYSRMFESDNSPLLADPRRLPTRQRGLSAGSIDPYEDPVEGLHRVSSLSNVRTDARRRREEEESRFRIVNNSPGAEGNEEALSSKYESLNYEICENMLYRREEQLPEHHVNLWRQSRNRWIASFFIGIVTALVACAIDIMVHYSKDIKFGLLLRDLIKICDEEESLIEGSCMWMVVAAWIGYNCILVAIAASLVIFWAPIAGGSGIPQVKCFLNGIKVPEVVKLKTLISKSIGVACAVGGGLAAGKEGPMIHSGAVVGAGVSQGKISSLGIDFGIFREFRNDRETRDFVSAGSAAGVAAAFGAPIGGVLFSLEEGASFWNQNLTWRMFFTAMVSSFTVNSILSWFNGQSGWLSWTGLANFGVFENKNYNIWEIPFFLLMGVIGGVTGAAFNVLNTKLSVFRKRFVRNRWQRLFECLLVASVSAFLGFVTLFIVDDCHPVGVNQNNTIVDQMWCKKGEYSAVANLFFQNPEESVKSLLHSPLNSFRPWTLLIFAVEYYLLTLWTFALPIPAGVFIPLLLCGAAWGRLYGITMGRLFPSITGLDPGKYALAGAAAQLGGVVRMTISLTAIIMEATRDITFGLPIMLVLMITKWVGDIFSESLYDMHIDLAEVPVLGWHPPKMSRNILAESVMRSDVVALEPRERVARIVEILRTTSHHGFPIVDRIEESMCQGSTLPDYGHLKGVILRSQLITLLEKKVFSPDNDDLHRMRFACVGKATLTDFNDSENTEEKGVDDLGLGLEDELCWLDLSEFMHPHPHRVPLNASLPFIFRLFRGLGLRYLFVVNDQNKLRGTITRKDLARFRERRHNHKYLVQERPIADDSR